MKFENGDMDKEAINEMLKKHLENHSNRTIHKILTEQIIDTSPDYRLVEIVLDNLTEKIPKDYHDEYQIVLSWTKPQQAIYITWWLEAELYNGGFNQYYQNSAGRFFKQLPDSLNLIGASKLAEITERANATYLIEKENIEKQLDGTVKGFSKSYENNPLNNFDREFYDIEGVENLQELQIAFIRRNKADFIDR